MLDTFRRADASSITAIEEEMDIRQTRELFVLFALGSQFDHLIKQALAKLGVFCLVADPASVTAKDIEIVQPKGIILSGGPVSVYTDAPPFDAEIFDLGIPVLGICLGAQLWARHIGAPVEPAKEKEFGRHLFTVEEGWNPLFEGCPREFRVLQSHGDRIMSLGHLDVLGRTPNTPVAASRSEHLWGVQFHPEVSDTDYGLKILENFCFKICNAKDRYPVKNVAERKIRQLRDQIEHRRTLLLLSGGSDSSVVCFLLKHAIAMSTRSYARAVYIRGIDRPDDEAYVRQLAEREASWLDFKVVDATENFLTALKGLTKMRDKRIAMRGVYKAIAENEAFAFNANFIAQGTLYTDISESGGGYESGARKAQIKLHHNINLQFTLPELNPLDDCVKDNARDIGREIGVPEELLTRHPFPGPGLVVRIEGEVTAEKLRIARAVDGIYVEELRRANLYNSVWQAGAVVTESVHTYSKGDDAGEGICVRLWAVWSVNGFTATPARLDYDFLEHVAQRITNEVHEVASVDYRVSGKPPATIEVG